MTNLEILNQLEQDGKLKQLVKSGLFPAKVYMYRQIYLFFTSRRAIIGTKLAKIEAEIQFNVSRRTVLRAIQSMK